MRETRATTMMALVICASCGQPNDKPASRGWFIPPIYGDFGPRFIVQGKLRFGWLVGWLVERLTAVAVVHRHNLHQQISGSAPETSEQKQEQERKDSKQKKALNNPKKEPLTS